MSQKVQVKSKRMTKKNRTKAKGTLRRSKVTVRSGSKTR